MYQWLCHEPEVAPHLPDTVLYVSPADALAMLERISGDLYKADPWITGPGHLPDPKADKWLCQFGRGESTVAWNWMVPIKPLSL
jgi:hypothetical protein